MIFLSFDVQRKGQSQDHEVIFFRDVLCRRKWRKALFVPTLKSSSSYQRKSISRVARSILNPEFIQ